jgi:hypothetical protein
VQLQQVGDQLAQAKRLTNELEQKLEYSNVARYNALGLLGLAGQGLTETSPLNKIFGAYVHNDPNNFHWDCTPEAVTAYNETIKLESKFPFPYYYRGLCEKANNTGDWQSDIETARKILLITTQIPGHNEHHDQVLKLIEGGKYRLKANPRCRKKGRI